MRLSIIIPAYNEARTIGTLIERVQSVQLEGYEKEIIVVDDGSKDETSAIAKRSGVIVVVHPKNRGKGAAVRTGFEKATGKYVVVQDADLEYDPNDFRAMLRCAKEKGAQVIYGSRRLPRANEKPNRGAWYFYAGGLLLTILTNILYRTRITDEPTCYKMIHRDVLKKIRLTAEGFEFCPEITAKIARLGIPIYEVPISYAPRSVAEGKKIRLRDWFIAVWTLLKNRL
ncbi:MAG: glycosyl transferase 2 [Parcubacteria group bacterium Gr01-1014_8]|nr:MAG: glycosyl transferase 2 [Parcubacteria group bacterium Gr01-1014_8]